MCPRGKDRPIAREHGRFKSPSEFAELETFAGRRLEAWDVGFYAEALQRERFRISQEELRPYFPLPKVLDGLFDVAERLFAVRISELRDAPSWHPDVRSFAISSAAGAPLGSFYLDAYARPNKRSGAWMDECIGRKRLASGSALPVAYLVCNFLPPGASRPALLTHDDVVTLFHEFGHGLHHLLTSVDYPSIAALTRHLLTLVSNEPVRERRHVVSASAPHDAIAIIGLACRFPGGANDEESYWRLLCEGKDAISEVPRTRWNID